MKINLKRIKEFLFNVGLGEYNYVYRIYVGGRLATEMKLDYSRCINLGDKIEETFL